MTTRERIHYLLQIHNLTQTWLIANLADMGHDTTKTNMSDILRGVRSNDEVLNAAINLLEDYDKWIRQYKKNYSTR